ncbi:MAG: Nif3-like dinuclear metal center hexameric protein [Candidatus Micrarchaeia archaeon]
MAKLDSIARFLNKTFNVGQVEDSSFNGLQYSGANNVAKVALAVDACVQTFHLAKSQGCQMLVVHHGLFWKNCLPSKITGVWKKRLSFLSQSDLSLYALHLPLDMHPGFGNNALLCRQIGLKALKIFGNHNGQSVGFKGFLSKKLSVREFENLLKKKIGGERVSLRFGSKEILKVGVVSGGGAFAIEEAADEGLDAFITGEVKHSHYHLAKECGINVFALGHYDTETPGVSAVGKLLEKKFGVKTVFLDAPTGL